MNRILIVLFSLFYGTLALGQRRFSYNSPGTTCYTQFYAYSQDGKYTFAKRPIIFMIGKEGERADQLYERDTLRYVPEFSGHLFIYLPNNGGKTGLIKLSCIEDVASNLTYNFNPAYNNLFLKIDDPQISEQDVNEAGLNKHFRKVKFSIPTNQPKDSVVAEPANITETKSNILNEFKTGSDAPLEGENKQTYFGPPKTFNFTLSGKLVDENTSEALPFATVSIKGKTIGTTTNADGQFSLIHFPNDTTSLVISYLGYKKTDLKLTPLMSKNNLVIAVQPLPSQLDEVTISTEKEDLMKAGGDNLSVIKMSPSKLNQLPNIGEKDIMRSFQLMPGVSASNESSSGLYVRGGTPDQNLVVYDGITIYQVDHLYGFYSAFNSNAIKDVQLYKGGFESKFGGRLSSVVEITGKDGNQNNFNAGGDISLLSVNAFVETPLGSKFTFLAAGRRSFKGPLYNKIFDQYNTKPAQPSFGGRSSNFASTVSSYFYDLNSKLTYRPTQNDIISLSVYNGTDKLDNSRTVAPRSRLGSTGSSFSSSVTDLTKYGNTGLSLKWGRKWNSRLYGNTLLSYSNFFSSRDLSNELKSTTSAGVETSRKFGTFENNNLLDYSFKSDYIFDASNTHQIGFGGWATYYDIAYKYSQNDTSTILNRHNFGVLTGLYLQDKIKLAANKLIFTPGLRASYYGLTNQMYYEPRASASYNFNKRLSFKASTGRYYQFANQITREDILNGNKTFWILSDGKNVPVSQSIHYISGISYDAHDYLFSIEGWYKDLSGLTEHSLRFNSSPTGISYNENFFQGKGYSKGLEFFVQKKFGKLSGWVSYTLAQTRSKFLVYSNDYYAANQDVTNEFKVVGIYKWKKIVFSLTWIYATGRPYTAPSGAYSLTLLDGTTQDYFTVTSKNSLRLPDYHRLDMAATYLFKNDDGREFGSFSLSVFNVYDHRNTWYETFQIVDKEIIQTDIKYLGFTPNVTLSLRIR